MNTTFKEVIFNIKNLRQAGRQSQDALLSDPQYAFIIDYYRAILIQREYDGKKKLAPQLEQTVKQKFVRDKGMEDEIFQEVRVYTADLPTVVQSSTRPLYQGVRSSMLKRSIDRSTSITIRTDLQAPITGNWAKYFPLDNKLYIVTPEPLQEMFVTAVFERPIEIWKLDPKFDPFDPYNFEYPMTFKLLDALYKMMVDGELRLSMVMPNDIQADGQETQGQAPKQTKQQDQD
jgi:hypothetical protein